MSSTSKRDQPRVLPVRLNESLYGTIKALALDRNQSMSEFARTAMREKIDRIHAQRDADEGRALRDAEREGWPHAEDEE